MFVLRPLAPLLFLWCAIAGYAQTTLRVFTSPDGVFRFKYSPLLVDCTKLTPSQPTSSGVPAVFVGHPPPLSIPDSCSSQAGVCSDLGGQATTLACFAYPKDKFKDKPTFTAAMFLVGQVEQATTEKDCLQGSQNWNEIATATTSKINGVTFKVFDIGDNWAGGGQGGPVYRSFHDKKCYELGIQTAMVRGGYDPGTIQEFTKKDSEEVQRQLKQALSSFTFVR